MVASIQDSADFLFGAIYELVFNDYVAFTLGNKVYLIIVLCKFFILLDKHCFWGLKHCIHSFDDVVDDLVVIVYVLIAYLQQMACNVICIYCLLENLYRAQNPIGLRNSFAHEIIKFILQS